MNIIRLIRWVVGSCLAVWMLHAWHSRREEALLRDHVDLLQSRDRQWALDRSDRELSALEEIRRQSARHHDELVKASGSELAAALCDPKVSLIQTLQLFAQQCLPTNAVVQIRVDRFVEFEVLATLATSARPEELAGWSRCLLGSTGGLVHSLRFAVGGEVVGSLDHLTLESVTNWTRISDAELISWLTEPVSVPVNGPVPGENVGVEASDEEYDSDTARLRQAWAGFDSWRKQQLDGFNEKMQELRQMTDLNSLSAVAEVNRRLGRNRVVLAEVTELRNLLVDPSPELSGRLMDAELDPVIVIATVREFRERSRQLTPAADETVRRLGEFSDRLQTFLSTLGAHWGSWEVQPGGNSIRFTNENTRDAFDSANSRLVLAAVGLDAALAEWARAVTSSVIKK